MNRSLSIAGFRRTPRNCTKTRRWVVLELAEYVTSNARGEAESIAATGAADGDPKALENVLGSHRITLQGGFALVYGKDRHVVASYQAPPDNSAASLIPWLPERSEAGAPEAIVQLHGPLSANLLTSAQRNDEPVIRIGGQDYAVGMSVTASGKIVVAALPMPQGLSQ